MLTRVVQPIGNYTGAFLKLKLPYKIELKSFSVRNRSDGSTNANQSPEDFKIIGSNDETNWEELFSISGVVWASTQINKIYSITSNPKTYRYLAFVCTRTVADTSVIIGHIKFFGTPGPTTLDKGSLTLGRSLDVPRISRYDVDTETPRPEKLLIDYDTTVNSSLTDISGQGNHGSFINGSSYSAPDKAFTFDGGDYSVTVITIPGGNMTWTQSMWFKSKGFSASPNFNVLSFFGSKSPGASHIWNYKADQMWQDHYGRGVYFNYTFEENIWYHAVSVYHGNTSTDANVRSSMYINGVKQTLIASGLTAAVQTIPTTTNYELADYISGTHSSGAGGNARHNGLISNVKFYSVALEPSEVKKLYNLGRTGRSMVISDTAVGIGKVPEAQLDVRGNLGVSGHITNSGPRLEICDDSTSVHGYGTAGKGVKFSHAGIVFDRTWGNYPSLGVFTKNIDGNTNQAEFRIHGFDQSYISYPDSSGEADFSVVTRCDGGYQSGSDRRMKINITTIDEALKKVCLLTGKRYQLINRNGDINKNVSQNSYNYGLIAQDIEKAGIDEIYKHNEHEDDKTENYNSAYSINYDSIVPILINAIKELHAEIQTLEHKDHTRELRIENNSLKSKITRLERKTTDQELELIQLKRRLNKLERPT